MKLTIEQKKIIDLLLYKYGKDWFEFEIGHSSKYDNFLTNLSIFEPKMGRENYGNFSQFFRIRNSFYKKYNRTIKLNKIKDESY